MKSQLIFLMLALLLAISVVSAHVDEGQLETPTIVRWIWESHSWTHWMIWIGFIYTCYYFRFVSGRTSGNPAVCGITGKNDGSYKGEDGIKYYHRVFVLLMIVWLAIHYSELFGEMLGYSHPVVYSFGPFIPGVEILEWIYLLSATGFLFSCHYVRYLAGSGNKCFSCMSFGKQRADVFGLQTRLNNYHGHLFWIAIVSIILLLLAGGHL